MTARIFAGALGAITCMTLVICALFAMPTYGVAIIAIPFVWCAICVFAFLPLIVVGIPLDLLIRRLGREIETPGELITLACLLGACFGIVTLFAANALFVGSSAAAAIVIFGGMGGIAWGAVIAHELNEDNRRKAVRMRNARPKISPRKQFTPPWFFNTDNLDHENRVYGYVS